MQDGDNTGGTQEVDVGVQQNLLDCLPLRAITTTGHRTTVCSLTSTLLGALVNASEDAELPVGQVVEGNPQRHLGHGRVQLGHVGLELPEGVEE